MQSEASNFERLSEEALRIVKQLTRIRKSKKRKLVEIEVGDLKKSLDEVTNARLSASQR